MSRRVWAGTLNHVGGLGVFSLFLFGVLSAFMVHRGQLWLAALALIVWYVQARMTREKYMERNEAIATVNELEAADKLTPEQASKLRRAIRND